MAELKFPLPLASKCKLKQLAMFGNLSQFPQGGKLSFKMMAFNASFFFPHSTNQKKSSLKRYCAVQDLTEALVKGANIVKDL